MGFNFRKSFKIAPGVRLNVGKKGISSVSVGGKGARVSVGKREREQQSQHQVLDCPTHHIKRTENLKRV